jgi:hypothetical protein
MNFQRKTSFFLFCSLLILLVLIPFAISGWRSLFTKALEAKAPLIKIIHKPIGIGRAPEEVVIGINDKGSGISEAKVDLIRNDEIQVLYSKLLYGSNFKKLSFIFPGEMSYVDPGEFFIDITVKDRSFWSNKANLRFSLTADFAEPKITLLNEPDSIIQGGVGIVFYRVEAEEDRVENLISGIKLGKNFFYGFRAQDFDQLLDDPHLYVVLFTVPIDDNSAEDRAELFAIDQVRNSSSLSVFLPVIPRNRILESVNATPERLAREIVIPLNKEKKRIDDFTKLSGEIVEFPDRNEVKKPDYEKYFDIIENMLLPLDDYEIKYNSYSILSDRMWHGLMLEPNGAPLSRFGTRLEYINRSRTYGSIPNDGYNIRLSNKEVVVNAIESGIVKFVGKCGFLGSCIIIDHGLGVASLYSRLESAFLSINSKVDKGKPIARASILPGSDDRYYHLQMRLQGIPIDPTAWWDKSREQLPFIDVLQKVRQKLGVGIE